MNFSGKEKMRGITLVALIVTIIVMLILAGISINAIVGDNGIVTKSMEASFKNEMSQYLEETETYVLTKQMETGDYDSVYYAGDTNLNTIYRTIFEDLYVLSGSTLSSADITEVTSIDTDEYKTHLGVEANHLTWYTDDGEANEVEWCLDLGIQVYVDGYGYMGSDGEYIIYSDGDYAKHGDTWLCEPDLSGFSTGNTYYVIYDSDNQTMSSTTADYKIYNEVPDGWYDYNTNTGTSKWANIVTIANQHIAYWVWVPRYVYKITNTSNISTEAVDIRFVNTQNQWTDSNGNTYEYAQLQAEGYMLADSFTYGESDLAGIWVAKYEISDPKEPIGFSVQANENSITIYSITWDGESNVTDDALASQVERAEVEISYSGGGQSGTIKSTLPYTIEGLGSGVSYNIQVTTPTYGIDPLTLSKTVSTLEGTVEDLTSPDMRGFNEANTYYADFSSGTEAKIGEAVQVSTEEDKWRKMTAANAPDGWYDYNSQKWANVLTINHETGDAAYWVWIPRYEYYVDTEMNICDIIFISPDKTEADEGYSIPTAFTTKDSNGNTHELSGIWVMKYEIQDIMVPTGFYSSITSNSIEITNLSYSDGNGFSSSNARMPNTANVSITPTSGGQSGSINGTLSGGRYVIGSGSSNTVKITGLTPGATYNVTLVVPLSYTDESNGTVYTKTITQSITLPQSDRTASAPDVSGFLSSNDTYAYYIYYPTNSTQDSNAIIGERITSGSSPSRTWYDYNNKMWANILVTDTDLASQGLTLGSSTVGQISENINVNIFVWIPRYEYKYDSESRTTTLLMLNSGSQADSGYIVPDAFTFGGKDLSGFWAAKYEIYDPEKAEN